MTEDRDLESAREVSFRSSLRDDVWHGLGGPAAFESWHFDAVSDDGREALVVSFCDNYPLSPRFHAVAKGAGAATGNSRSSSERFPAVSLVYSVGGKAVFDAVNEYGGNDFRVNVYDLDYSVGDSSFRISQAEYGVGFFVLLDIRTARGRRITAELEWLFVESDLLPLTEFGKAAVWNIVAPRADVSGWIRLISRRGEIKHTVHFRGTGYHDQISSQNIHYRDLGSRMWGRAHFVDSTIVFERHRGVQNKSAPGRFYLIRDGKIHEREASCDVSEPRRDRWGLVIPGRISYLSADNIRLRIKPLTTIRSAFSEVKMLSEMTLSLRDGRPRKTIGLTEFVDPSRMKSWVFKRISDLRIGRKDRSPLF